MSERLGKHHIGSEGSKSPDVTPEKRLERALNRIAFTLDQSRKSDAALDRQALAGHVESLRCKVKDLRDRLDVGDTS